MYNKIVKNNDNKNKYIVKRTFIKFSLIFLIDQVKYEEINRNFNKINKINTELVAS